MSLIRRRTELWWEESGQCPWKTNDYEMSPMDHAVSDMLDFLFSCSSTCGLKNLRNLLPQSIKVLFKHEKLCAEMKTFS